MTANPLHQKIENWKRQLIDLSRRNRLLYFKSTKLGHLMVAHPDTSVIFERLAVDGKFFRTSRVVEKDEEDSGESGQASLFDEDEDVEEDTEPRADEMWFNRKGKDLENALYSIRLRSRTAMEGQGVNILYVALGFLEWFEPGQSESVRSPILLVPVELKRGKNDRPAEIHPLEEDIVVNPTLRHALHLYHGISLPELPEGFSEEREDYASYLSRVRSAIRSQSRWQIHDEACLGLFSFTKFIMYRDLEDHRDLLEKHPLVRALAGDSSALPEVPDTIPTGRKLDEKVSPTEAYHVLDADSSQQEAIELAKQGVSFVLEGPPGTGKSQTITNIIAELLAQGKKVLFVSEKMAALQVVYNRLAQVGLSEFSLELHSHKSKKKQIAEKLNRTLTGTAEEGCPASDIDLDRLARLRSDLNRVVEALHEPRTSLELSAYQVYGRLTRYRTAPKASVGMGSVAKVTSAQLREWEELLGRLESQSDLWRDQKTHPWRGLKVEAFSFALCDELEGLLPRLVRALRAYRALLSKLSEEYELSPPRDLKSANTLFQVLTSFTDGFWRAYGDRLAETAGRFRRWETSAFRTGSPGYWVDVWRSRRWWRNGRPDLAEQARLLDLAASLRVSSSGKGHAVPQGDDPDLIVKELTEAEKTLGDDLERFSELVDLNHVMPSDQALEASPWETVEETLTRLAENLDLIEPWLAFVANMKAARKAGLEAFLEQAGDLSAGDLLPAFHRAFYERWVDEVHQEEPLLRDFMGNHHERLIEEFRRLDRAFVEANRQRVRRMLARNRPNGSLVKSGSAETSILRKEANKKRRHLPIRALFQSIPGLLGRLKPCLLMSPLSVSQYLDPNFHVFDTVIFDEASQIKPEDAIGSILRAKQWIIVGDSHQLPPTSFFDALTGGDESGDEEDDYGSYESILNEGKTAGLPEMMLRWHYRSRDESLIAFSNYHFYKNELYTFPHSAPAVESLGVDFVYVPDGVYDRGKSRTNRVEARRVAEMVLEHFDTTPERSLGVVAFSQAQQEAILREIERLRVLRGDFAAWLDADNGEPFFVKNLENVQGDERDCMFISVGYGRDAAGKLSLNFGPLNKDGGARRLNVAVTRAKENLKLIASIRGDDVPAKTEHAGANPKDQGVFLLKNYLHYAERGVEALAGAA